MNSHTGVSGRTRNTGNTIVDTGQGGNNNNIPAYSSLRQQYVPEKKEKFPKEKYVLEDMCEQKL